MDPKRFIWSEFATTRLLHLLLMPRIVSGFAQHRGYTDAALGSLIPRLSSPEYGLEGLTVKQIRTKVDTLKQDTDTGFVS